MFEINAYLVKIAIQYRFDFTKWTQTTKIELEIKSVRHSYVFSLLLGRFSYLPTIAVYKKKKKCTWTFSELFWAVHCKFKNNGFGIFFNIKQHKPAFVFGVNFCFELSKNKNKNNENTYE